MKVSYSPNNFFSRQNYALLLRIFYLSQNEVTNTTFTLKINNFFSFFHESYVPKCLFFYVFKSKKYPIITDIESLKKVLIGSAYLFTLIKTFPYFISERV